MVGAEVDGALHLLTDVGLAKQAGVLAQCLQQQPLLLQTDLRVQLADEDSPEAFFSST